MNLIKMEAILSLRDKVGPLWGVGFPLLLLIVLGNVPSLREEIEPGVTIFDLYVPVLVLFNLAMLALIAVPTVLAGYRENGVLRRLHTTPVGPARVLAAQLVANLGIAVVAAVLFLAVARLAFGVGLPGSGLSFLLSWLLVAAAMLAIGLLITALAPGRAAATAVGTILYFPMMFFAGLWVPISAMPPLLRDISHATPLGAGMEAFQHAYAGDFPPAQPLLILLGYAVVGAAVAIRWFRWA
ncbi:ABC transporter permease [Actinoplanes sp. NPDC023714]|uniref:ABC transporter permease n=1 Tax=Actinoplanes sp. NPDC023714 TaxID=3154322 RepID=UPI0033F7AB61